MEFEQSLDFARKLDENDPLKKFRKRFYLPPHNGKKAVYFCGNSLGLQPKTVRENINLELDDWAKHGVEGHFQAKYPWFSYHEILTNETARLVGALPVEVVMMNQLTVNLHFLMVSFYRPAGKRYKILCEQKAFPSDQYVMETQARFHGFDPDQAIIEVGPREGEYTIRHEDIISAIEKNSDELALIMIGGVNYFSGQAFDMKSITEAGHKAGAVVGFDLAHAAGNLKMELHNWNVDFAAWCSYKYLNSGPGSVAGAFVHEKHATSFDLPRFGGWWGHDKHKRFLMEKGFSPIKGAEGWALSNAPVFSMAANKAALDIFDEAGMDALCKKSEILTGYLEFTIEEINRKKNCNLQIITPKNKKERGCQLSIIAHDHGKDLYNLLTQNGVISDWREPNVIRVAPVPLYNSFEDVFTFGQVLEKII
jgi:kynureninase